MARFRSTLRRSKLRLAALLVVCLISLSTTSTATPQPTAAQHDSTDRYFSKLLVGLQKSRLGSGLRVLLSVDRGNPIVALATCFKAGRVEPDSPHLLVELAAYLRHRRVLAKAKPDHQLSRARGARESEQLGPDYSCFTSVLPASELAFGLWLEAQRLRSLQEMPQYAEAIARQRREAWQLLDPRAAARLQLELLARGEAHTAPASAGSGSPTELMIELNQHFFSADEAVLALVGDFDPDQASRWIRQYFKPHVPEPKAPKARKPQSGVESAKTPALESAGAESISNADALFVGFAHAAPSAADRAALDLLARLLTLDMDSRAHRAFLGAAGATHFGTEVYGLGDRSLFILHLRLEPSANPARAEAELLRRLATYAVRQPIAAALERAKTMALVSWLADFASQQRRAALLGRYEVLLGDARLAARHHLALSAVTAEDVQRVSKSLVAERHVTLRASGSRGGNP
jgi:zinc protease